MVSSTSSTFFAIVAFPFAVATVSGQHYNYHHSNLAQQLSTNPSIRQRLLLSQRHRYVRSLQEAAPAVATTTDDPSCSGSPWLWEITEDATGDVTGYGIGTIHFPTDIVSTEQNFEAVMAAANSSCAVYTELNQSDPAIEAELVACTTEVTLDPNKPSARDIPDDDLREQYLAVLDEIAAEYGLAFHYLPLFLSTLYISFYNTPEVRDIMMSGVTTGVEPEVFDNTIGAMGRPSAGLEKPLMQCEALEDQSPKSLEDLVQNFDSHWKAQLEFQLTASNTPLLEAYWCGDADRLETAFFESSGSDPNSTANQEAMKVLNDDRNVEMAEKIVQIMEESSSPSVFAVGVAHWQAGPKNLQILLKEEGYTATRIDDVDTFVSSVSSLSDSMCNYEPPIEEDDVVETMVEEILDDISTDDVVEVMEDILDEFSSSSSSSSSSSPVQLGLYALAGMMTLFLLL